MGRWLKLTAFALAVGSLLLATAACGGGDENGEEPSETNTPIAETPAETQAETPAETANGGGGPSAELEITALNTLFDTDQLEAPAGQELTITIDNQDAGIPHDFDIFEMEGDDVGERVFDGTLFAGLETKTFTVPALEAGTYQFICSAHPATMLGTLIVK